MSSDLEHFVVTRPRRLRWAWWLPYQWCGDCGWRQGWPCPAVSRVPAVRWVGGYNITAPATVEPPPAPTPRWYLPRPVNRSYRTGWLRNGGIR